MGGKHKKAQRTKQNAKPSSSGRSAELLGTSLLPCTPAVSTSSIKPGLGFSLSGLSVPNDEDICSDINFQLIFKKMNKRDGTTKTKALRQFTDLVQESSSEAVKAILTFWARLYGVLSTDVDHHVREASQTAHYQVVSKVERSMAPYLKQFVPPWFISQYDTYAPAATAAAKSFKSIFPSHKIPEVLIYCQNEILGYIHENVILQTIPNISNSKNVVNEDLDARCERLLISSLQAYGSYLQKLSEENLMKAHDLNAKIVQNTKFWKLAKHKSVPVRAALFANLSILTQKASFLIENEKNHVCTVVFGNLDEHEPNVAPFIWEAALVIMSTVREWWNVINVEKYILPKLWRLLKEGGKGNARIIHPHILPFIDKLSSVIDMNSHWHTFFENFISGLKQKNVATSKTDTSAIANSLIECMKYVIMKNYIHTSFCGDVIQSYLLPPLSWCLTTDQSSHKIFFKQVASLVLYWSQISNQKDNDHYQKYLRGFWDTLFNIFTQTLNCESNESIVICEISRKQVDLLQSFREVIVVEFEMKVKFIDEASDCSTQEKKRVDADEYVKELDQFVYRVCGLYISLIDDRELADLLQPLYMIVEIFDSHALFAYLGKHCKKLDEPGGLMSLYHGVLYRWMNSENLSHEIVTNLIFSLYKYLNSEEKNTIVETFSSIIKFEYMLCCIRNCLSRPLIMDPAIRFWLCSKQVSNFLEECVDKLIEDNNIDSEIYTTLEDVFRLTEDGEKCVSEETLIKIIKKLVLHLKNPNNFESTLDAYASLTSYIAKVAYSRMDLFQYNEDLLLVLFHLLCYSNTYSDILNSDTISKVKETWIYVITVLGQYLPEESLKHIITTLATFVETEFLNCSVTDMFISDVLVDLFRELSKTAKLKLSDMLNLFFNKPFVDVTRQYITNVCIMAEYIKGNISLPYVNIFKSNASDPDDVTIGKYSAWNCLKVDVLCAMSKSSTSGHDKSKDMMELLIYVLFDCALAVIFSDNYQSTKFHKNVQLILNNLKQRVSSLLSSEPDMTNIILNMVLEKLEEDCWIWYKLLNLLYTEILPNESTETYAIVSQQLSQNDNKIGLCYLAKLFEKQVPQELVNCDNNVTESIIILRSTARSEENKMHINEVMSKVNGIDHTHFDWSTASWAEVQTIIEASRFFASLLRDKQNTVNPKYWDVIVIFLATWTDNIIKLRTSYKQIEVEALITAIADLFLSLENYVSDLKAENPNHNFVSEWRDLFAQNTHDNIFHLWMYFSEKIKAEEIEHNLHLLPFLEEFGVVVTKCNYKSIFQGDTLPKWSKFRDQCFQLLRSQNTLMQLWGYKMLLILVPGLVDIDSQAVLTHTPHKNGLTLKQFEQLLVSVQDILSIMLLDIRLGESSCQVQEFTDSYTYTLAYLLLWDVLLSLCEQSSTELNYQYADWLKETSLLHNGLNIFYRLMPAEVLHYTDNKQNQFVDMFMKRPTMNSKGPCTCKELEHLVCWVYTFALSQLPALVRQWWSSLEIRIAQVVERVTVTYVSPYICMQELSAMMKHEAAFKNMTVKVVPGAREVLAIYTVDEAQMELVIVLPPNYPLGSPDVQCNKQIGGTSHKQWLMQLKKCLLHQNGSVWDGLALWNKNLNRKFDGVEECYICFGVLHPGTYQLPKLSCQTCKKKFHSACLYKWFSTSNKSSCPICRNLF